MRIKKLELLGFKSFKDKTVISFDAGITGIVGPNGCGKSNIVDALVWVMGEMSAKHLRGSSMEDVIFAGSQDYAPMGLAEVSLTLENDGGAFPVRYLNHSEVMVTRRLHRGGESEYFINKEPCRLRDIQEIFMDTGAGSKGFSIIEQGQIGKIITSKPHERRSLIEEAAGITKFKARKKESERKLKATDQNLVRLADIIRELKRQLDSLERQAQKAERYKKIKDELREKELWLSALEVRQGQTAFANYQEQMEELEAEEQGLGSEIQSMQAQIEEERMQSLETEKALEVEQLAFKSMADHVLQSENNIRELEFEIEQTKRSKEIKGSVYEQNQARLQVVQTEKEELTEKYQDLKAQFEDIDEEYSSLDEQFQERQAEMSEKESVVTSSRKSQLELQQGAAHLYALAEGLKAKIEAATEEHQMKLDMKLEVEEQNKEFFQRHGQLEEEFEAEKHVQGELQGQFEELTQKKEELFAVQEALLEQKSEFTKEYNVAHSKLETLKELQEQFEGYQEGLKNILLYKKEQGLVEPGSPLSEFIEAPKEYEAALEACLADGLQGLFGVGKLSEISDSRGYLTQQNKGRVSFFVEEFITVFSGQGVGGVESLGSYALSGLSQSVKTFLDKIYLVENLDQAQEVLSKSVGICITKQGEWANSLGQVHLGSSSKTGSGLLARKKSVESLQQLVAEFSEKLENLEKQIDQSKQELEDVLSEHEEVQGKVNEQNFKVFDLEKELGRAEQEKSKAQSQVEKIQVSLSEAEEKKLNFSGHLEEHQAKAEEYEEKQRQLEQETLETEESLAELRAQFSDLQAEVTDKKIKHASYKSELESLEERLESVSSSEEQILSELGELEQESENSDSFISSYSGELSQKRAELERDIEKQKELELKVARIKNDYEKLTQVSRELSETVTAHTISKSKLEARLSELRVKSEQVQTNLQTAVDQIFEKYEVDLTERFESYLESFEESEKDTVKQGTSDLRQKLGRMGEVNLSAIHEFDDIKSRYTFLSEQQDDLLKAKAQLEKVILRIDRICSRRFRETFEAVNERFKKVFPVLFGGGEARLILVEKEGEEKDQEPGLDIEAKPPGKKAQNVSLLSGGEKALTAVSLIFSIFLVKPSPYCLLDEVDAPLDDANVFRFNDLVKEMSKRSQIILVTHNKNTMAVNNKLYGVTQEERGVSKMVSVGLDGSFVKEASA